MAEGVTNEAFIGTVNALSTNVVKQSGRLVESLAQLTTAINSSAAAAEKHAENLVKTTKWLAIATGALVLVTIAHVDRGHRNGALKR